jgi:hypothetical protein
MSALAGLRPSCTSTCASGYSVDNLALKQYGPKRKSRKLRGLPQETRSAMQPDALPNADHSAHQVYLAQDI